MSEQEPPAAPGSRSELLSHPDRIVARKKARLVAVKMPGAFAIDTENGTMMGLAGDYAATNHPDDDPTSDVWVLSADRFRSSYELEPEGS